MSTILSKSSWTIKLCIPWNSYLLSDLLPCVISQLCPVHLISCSAASKRTNIITSQPPFTRFPQRRSTITANNLPPKSEAQHRDGSVRSLAEYAVCKWTKILIPRRLLKGLCFCSVRSFRLLLLSVVRGAYNRRPRAALVICLSQACSRRRGYARVVVR